MSLYYVNDHLIEDEATNESSWPQNNNEAYKRIMIRTTPQAVRKDDDTGEFVSFTKPICVHNMSLLKRGVNTRISSTIPKDAKYSRVTVRTSSDTRYDSDIFIVALPYNGMIKPFDHDEDSLAIFKSMIIKSDKLTIPHGDQNYKRVAYFVVRPYHGAFNQNTGWYEDKCNLSVTFAQSNRAARGMTDETAEWTFVTQTVRFGADGQVEITETTETAPYSSFNPDDIHKKPICKLVEPTKLDD